jgi:hypothetical protein
MDLGRAVGFVFEDEEWLKKVLIGGVLMLIPVFGQLLAVGYGLEIARRVVKGHPQPLPEWDEWGTKIIEGFMSGVIGFVWALPIIVVTSCFGLLLVPLTESGGDEVGFLFIVLSLCIGLIVLIYSLALALITPAALMNYAVSGELGAAFRFGEIFGMVRENLGAYLMVLVVTAIVTPLISAVGSIALGCGALFTSFYGMLVMYHAYGQAYRTAAGNVEGAVAYPY